MTASLYQSGSRVVSAEPCAMRLTLGAQRAHGKLSIYGAIAAGQDRHRLQTQFIASHCSRGRKLLPRKQHRLTANALPSAVAQHPGVGPGIGAAKGFSILAFSNFFSRATGDRNVRPVRAHDDTTVLGGCVGIGVAFDFLDEAGLALPVAFRRT